MTSNKNGRTPTSKIVTEERIKNNNNDQTSESKTIVNDESGKPEYKHVSYKRHKKVVQKRKYTSKALEQEREVKRSTTEKKIKAFITRTPEFGNYKDGNQEIRLFQTPRISQPTWGRVFATRSRQEVTTGHLADLKNRNIKLVSLNHQNIQSISNSVDELNEVLTDNPECSFLTIAEHWKTESQLKNYAVKDFNLASLHCRQEGQHGGVMLYERKEIKYKVKRNIYKVSAERSLSAQELNVT
ncbi:hypothetical protein HHI36_005237 [Cryptolaemus montrouzieri]|uniref:Uncharacterized protein n=1 Tax=Cryptolaemus montrouzieri TaxID=559131 RepID=A0ABD2NTT4_9CUCU